MQIATIGVVPDIHFALLYIAFEKKIFEKYGLNLEIKEYAGGTGELSNALANTPILDVGVGLTEGFVTSISNGADFKIVGTFVETPMRWVVLVPGNSSYNTIGDLKGRIFGITKFGGGSHINTLLMSNQKGWREGVDFHIQVLGDLKSLMLGLENGVVDSFVWELFSIKIFLDKKNLKVIDNLIPPWPCFVVAAKTDFIKQKNEKIKLILSVFRESAKIFHYNADLAIEMVSKNFNLSKSDSEIWFKCVRYSLDGRISVKSLEKIVTTLLKAKTIDYKPDITSLISPEFAQIDYP